MAATWHVCLTCHVVKNCCSKLLDKNLAISYKILLLSTKLRNRHFLFNFFICKHAIISTFADLRNGHVHVLTSSLSVTIPSETMDVYYFKSAAW